MDSQDIPDDLKLEILKRVAKRTTESLETEEREGDTQRAEQLLDQL